MQENVSLSERKPRKHAGRCFQELALAVDAHVQHILLVVFQTRPMKNAIGDDLAQEVGAVVGGLRDAANGATG